MNHVTNEVLQVSFRDCSRRFTKNELVYRYYFFKKPYKIEFLYSIFFKEFAKIRITSALVFKS